MRIDKKGRVLIPKSIREALGIRAKQQLRISIGNGRIVLEPIGGIADQYYGVVEVKEWPRDLDEFVVEAIQKWWKRSTWTSTSSSTGSQGTPCTARKQENG